MGSRRTFRLQKPGPVRFFKGHPVLKGCPGVFDIFAYFVSVYYVLLYLVSSG